MFVPSGLLERDLQSNERKAKSIGFPIAISSTSITVRSMDRFTNVIAFTIRTVAFCLIALTNSTTFTFYTVCFEFTVFTYFTTSTFFTLPLVFAVFADFDCLHSP